MQTQNEIVIVQVTDMEIDQMTEEARADPVTAEDQGVEMIVQRAGEEVRKVHQMAGAVATLQDVQVAGHLHKGRIVVITVEALASVHLQETALVLPEMEGEQAKRKLALLPAAGEILVDPAKNRAPALFFLFINLKNIFYGNKNRNPYTWSYKRTKKRRLA